METRLYFYITGADGLVGRLKGNIMKTIKFLRKSSISVLALAALLSGNALAEGKLPDHTDDGLDRIDAKHVDAVYWKEGATLEQYDSIKLLECTVAFRKDWMRDYNRDQISLSHRVDAKDMDRIKKKLAEEFNKEFSMVLQDKDGYTITDEVGENVLLLRPALVNLDVAAPDLKTADRSRTYTASAGSMILYLELYDSATSSIIGRVVDSKASRSDGRVMISNEITNRAEADRMLRNWAELLRKALDEAHGK